MEEIKEYSFKSVFEGIAQTQQTINEQLELLQKINAEQKIELKKAKHFNIFMAVVGIASLFISITSIIIACFLR